jgi:ADP-ribose pyrophosphatase
VSQDFEVIKSDLIFKGVILSLYVDKIKSPNGRILEREVVEHLDAVGVAALTKNKEILLVRQYRHAVRTSLLEIPAGLLEDTESPSECAIRELKEETGYLTGKVQKLAEFYTSAGFTNEKLHLFFTDDIEEGEPEREPGEEDMSLEVIPLDKAIEMIYRGDIKDGKTVIAILMAARQVG